MLTPLSVKKIELSEKKTPGHAREKSQGGGGTPLEVSSDHTHLLAENTLLGMGKQADFLLNKVADQD